MTRKQKIQWLMDVHAGKVDAKDLFFLTNRCTTIIFKGDYYNKRDGKCWFNIQGTDLFFQRREFEEYCKTHLRSEKYRHTLLFLPNKDNDENYPPIHWPKD